MTPPPEAPNFDCHLAGVIAAGRRRLFAFLAAVAVLMLGLGLYTLSQRRWVPALLCLLVVLVVWTAGRMSGDAIPRWLELRPGELVVQMQRGRAAYPLLEVEARPLDADEIDHLRGLSTHAGGVVAGTGGLESSRLGELEMFVSDLERAILVDTGEARLVLSPGDPGAFIAALPTTGEV